MSIRKHAAQRSAAERISQSSAVILVTEQMIPLLLIKRPAVDITHAAFLEASTTSQLSNVITVKLACELRIRH